MPNINIPSIKTSNINNSTSTYPHQHTHHHLHNQSLQALLILNAHPPQALQQRVRPRHQRRNASPCIALALIVPVPAPIPRRNQTHPPDPPRVVRLSRRRIVQHSIQTLPGDHDARVMPRRGALRLSARRDLRLNLPAQKSVSRRTAPSPLSTRLTRAPSRSPRRPVTSRRAARPSRGCVLHRPALRAPVA